MGNVASSVGAMQRQLPRPPGPSPKGQPRPSPKGGGGLATIMQQAMQQRAGTQASAPSPKASMGQQQPQLGPKNKAMVGIEPVAPPSASPKTTPARPSPKAQQPQPSPKGGGTSALRSHFQNMEGRQVAPGTNNQSFDRATLMRRAMSPVGSRYNQPDRNSPNADWRLM